MHFIVIAVALYVVVDKHLSRRNSTANVVANAIPMIGC